MAHNSVEPLRMKSSMIIYLYYILYILISQDVTLLPYSTLYRILEVSVEHLRRVWHADRGLLLLRTPCSVPFGFAHVLLVDTNPLSGRVVIFSGLCSPNIPRYFLDFAHTQTTNNHTIPMHIHQRNKQTVIF